MCNWKSWIWPGILTVTILTALALWMKADFIENDLKQKAAAALQASGQSWASVEMDGRDAVLTGNAPSEEARSQAATTTDEAYSVRVVDNRAGLLAVQSPFTLTASRDGQNVELSGFVPSEQARKTIVAAAGETVSGAQVTDNLTLARGAPEGLAAIAGFGFSQLSGLSKGQVDIKDTNFSVSGQAESLETFESINKAVSGTIPGAGALVSNTVSAPSVSPYIWSSSLSEGGITLDGYVPSVAVGDALVAKTQSEFPSVKIENKQRIASGEPAEFQAKAEFALDQLARFSNGAVSLADTELTVNGIAKTGVDFDAAVNATNGALPNGLTLGGSDITPPTVSPYVWQADRTADGVRLSGFVPDSATKTSIAAAVSETFPDIAVDDATRVAKGAPDGFAEAARFGVKQLGRLTQGAVKLSDTAFAIEGAAATIEDHQAAKTAVADELPNGFTLASQRITAPSISPYTWGAEYNGTDVTLKGFVPDETVRAEVLAEAKRALPAAEIKDDMKIASGAPASFASNVSSVLGLLPRFSRGQVAFSDDNLTVDGIGKSSANYLAAERSVLSGLSDTITVAKSSIQAPQNEGEYEWSARKTATSVVLSGAVPTKEARGLIAKSVATANPSASIVNRLVVETGAPANFQRNVDKGIAVLGSLKTGAAIIKNEDLLINGVASSVAAYEAVQEQKDAFSGTIKPARISPYSWSVTKHANKAVLSGFAPNLGIANSNVAALAATVKLPVENKQRIASGAPEGFGNAAAALMSGVAALEGSTATLTDQNVFLQGRAQSEDEATGVAERIAGLLPEGYTLRNQISYPLPAPPVVLKEEFVPASVPDPDPEPAPEVVLKEEFVPTPVPDPAPDPAPEVALKEEFVPSPVPDPAPEPAPEVVLKQEFVPKPVEAGKPAVCNVDFSTLLDGEKIQFDTARAVIKPQSFELLNRIANGLRECEGSKIQIGGHTDSRGSESYNQALSEARAKAVLDYMVAQQSVSAESLQAKGFGEAQPIAPNTPGERSKNRRIEFKILQSN